MRKILFLFFTVSSFTYAQIQFGNEITLVDETHWASDPNSLLLVDLDNDNFKDLVSTSFYGDLIMWHKNVDGDFSHFPRKIVSIQPIDGPTCIAHGDLNGDGFEDIIAGSNSWEDKIVWYRNLGNNNFSNEIVLSLNVNGPRVLHVSDVDDDGDLDILTGGRDDTVILLENVNEGSFQSPVVIYDGNYDTRRIKTADLNNDGLLDIISGHEDGTIYWAKNLGNNMFENRQYITGGSDNGTALDLLDVNNDGFLDVITANRYSDDNLRYILNDNGIAFQSQTPVIIDDLVDEPYEVFAKDMDNDNLADVVLSSWGNSNISWYKNLGDGSFDDKIIVTDDIRYPKSFIVGDINNDNLNDIISASDHNVADSFMDKISLFLNQDSGLNFDETIVNYKFGVPRDLKTADLNNDDNVDILLTSKDIIWFENHGNANFSSYKLISSTVDDGGYADSGIIDFNYDGLMDIISVRNNGIEVFLNEGDETFSDSFHKYENFHPNILLEDMDGDGHKDFISRFYDEGRYKIAWVKNNGDTSFGKMTVFNDSSYGFNPNRIAAGDVDKDGDIDIVVSSNQYSRIYILENNGEGVFSKQLIVESITTVPIDLEDVDNDGYLDIISGGYKLGNYSIYWIKNNEGSFESTSTLIDESTGVTAFQLRDIDNNGYKDLVCVIDETDSREYYDRVFYYLNDSSGFGPMVEVDKLDDVQSLDRDLVLDDINNDDKFDIITSYYFENKVSYYLNSSTLSIIDNQPAENSDFKVFPVPFSNTLQWTFSKNENNVNYIEIYDMLGKRLFNRTTTTAKKIDLGFLPRGMYLVIFDLSNGNKITRKILKE